MTLPRLLSGAVAGAWLASVAWPAAAQPSDFTLETAPSPAPGAVFALDEQGGASVSVACPKGPPDDGVTEVVASVSQFRDGQGNPVRAAIESAGSADVREPLSCVGGALTLKLRLSPLPTPGRYTGGLAVGWKNRTPARFGIVLERTVWRPATLVVDTTAARLEVVCPLWGCGGTTPMRWLSTRIREKSGSYPLEGVTVRMEQASRAGDFDLASNVDFRFDGKEALLTSAAPEHRVPVAGQAAVGLGFKQLAAGEYGATLRFQAANSGEDDAQKLALSLFVKHHWAWPVLVLLGAVLFSFFGTKYLTTRRQRLALTARVDEQDNEFLVHKPASTPLTWARATLHLIQEILDGSRIQIPELTVQRLAQVERLMPILHRLSKLRRSLPAQGGLPDLVRRRILTGIESLSGACSDLPLDEATAARVERTLAGLEAWLPSPQWRDPYGVSVLGSLATLVADVQPEALANLTARAQATRLLGDLKKLVEPGAQAPADMLDVERKYAKLKILWDRGKARAAETERLAQAIAGDEPLEQIFAIADDAAWDRIKAAERTLKILTPDPAPEAFDTFSLRVTTGDPELDRTFLFRYGLTFAWRIDFQGSRLQSLGRRFNRAAQPSARDQTAHPKMTHFAPGPGKVTVKVTVYRGNDSVEVPAAPFSVNASQTTSLARRFESTELVAAALAAAAAVVSGLVTFYAKAPAWGSFSDYLTLFLWGAAVDQGKNVLQLMQGK